MDLKFRSFEAVEHRIAESPNEWNFDVFSGSDSRSDTLLGF